MDYETDDRLHVKIFDANAARWEVPESVLPRPKVTKSHEKTANYRFGFVSKPFGFFVSRADTGELLFNSSASSNNPQFKNLVFEDQYLEISNQLPSGANVYGLGERVRALRLSEGLTYTLWNADEATPVDQNIYGFHPYYLEMRNGKAHGVVSQRKKKKRKKNQTTTTLWRMSWLISQSFSSFSLAAALELERHGH